MQLEALELRLAPSGLTLAQVASSIQQTSAEFSAAAQTVIQQLGQMYQTYAPLIASPQAAAAVSNQWIHLQQVEAAFSAADQLLTALVQNGGITSPQQMAGYLAAINLLASQVGIP